MAKIDPGGWGPLEGFHPQHSICVYCRHGLFDTIYKMLSVWAHSKLFDTILVLFFSKIVSLPSQGMSKVCIYTNLLRHSNLLDFSGFVIVDVYLAYYMEYCIYFICHFFVESNYPLLEFQHVSLVLL